MSKLDEVIANTAYILDCLQVLRSILDTGSCNDCTQSKDNACGYCPQWGARVRYNCPFYERKEGEERD